MLLLALLYIGLSALVAYFGRNRKFRFWGYFVASLLISPVIGLLFVLASDKRPPGGKGPAA